MQRACPDGNRVDPGCCAACRALVEEMIESRPNHINELTIALGMWPGDEACPWLRYRA